MGKIIFTMLLVLGTHAAKAEGLEKLPSLNVIKHATLSGSYSCKSEIKNWRLDLSEASVSSGDADLFLNYTCGSPISIQSGLTGFSLSLIADIGTLPLETVTMYKGLAPNWAVDESHNFRKEARLEVGHTYSVILNTSVARGMLIFTVDSIEGDEVKIRYAVKAYMGIEVWGMAPGMDYQAGSK